LGPSSAERMAGGRDAGRRSGRQKGSRTRNGVSLSLSSRFRTSSGRGGGRGGGTARSWRLDGGRPLQTFSCYDPDRRDCRRYERRTAADRSAKAVRGEDLYQGPPPERSEIRGAAFSGQGKALGPRGRRGSPPGDSRGEAPTRSRGGMSGTRWGALPISPPVLSRRSTRGRTDFNFFATTRTLLPGAFPLHGRRGGRVRDPHCATFETP